MRQQPEPDASEPADRDQSHREQQPDVGLPTTVEEGMDQDGVDGYAEESAYTPAPDLVEHADS